MPSSRGSSQPRDQTQSPTLQVDSLPSEPPGKFMNTGVGSLSLLQGIFPTQELNQGLLHCRRILYCLSHQGSPRILEWIAITSPGNLPIPGIEPGSPTLQADSLPAELPGKPGRSVSLLKYLFAVCLLMMAVAPALGEMDHVGFMHHRTLIARL